MQKKFVAYLTSGMGNRLRPLASAMAYCERTGRELLVYWDNVTPNGCLTPLDKLFKNTFNLISLEEIAELEGKIGLYTEKGKGHGAAREAERFGRDQLLKLSENNPLKNSIDIPLDSDEDVVIVYDNNYITAIPLEESIKQLRSLEPVDGVVKQVKTLAEKAEFFRGLKGVHARGTDFGLKQALEMYTTMINKEILPTEKFFLSTDDQALEKGLEEAFNQQIISRPGRLHLELNEGKEHWFDPDSFTISENHGIDALVDIYLLSCTNLVVFHPGSTFSEISRHLHGILWEKDPEFLLKSSLDLTQLQNDFRTKLLSMMPRKGQHIELNFSAGEFGPKYLEQAEKSYTYIETLGYKTPVLERMLFSGSSKPTLEWDADLVSQLVAIPSAQFPFNIFERLCPYPEAIPQLRKIAGYIPGRKVLIIGSEHPWLEIFCGLFKAKEVTTVEYRPIHWKGELKTQTEFKTILWQDFEQNLADYEGQYDLVLTYSSIEHSGLGRYGDPLTPAGDLYTFMIISKCLAEHGMAGVAFPVGQDLTHFNVHRIYGPIRIRALEIIGDMKLFGLATPEPAYLNVKEEEAFLRESGWGLDQLFKLPLGKYRQPLLCFGKVGFSNQNYNEHFA